MSKEPRTRTPDRIHEEMMRSLRPSLTAQYKVTLHALLQSPQWVKLGEDFNLSKREVQVAKLASVGYRSKDIAQVLYIESGTVRAHICRIMLKVGVRSRSGLPFKLLLAAGLIEVPEVVPYRGVE